MIWFNLGIPEITEFTNQW